MRPARPLDHPGAMRAILLLLVWAGAGVAQERPVVNVTQGSIMGNVTTKWGLTFLEFLKLPFAEPPVDELRFKNPVAAGPWGGVLDASEMPPPCDQLEVLGREDCLYLNVYTPTDALDGGEPKAVMVYIHGGAWISGSTQRYDDFEELLARDVIVAAVQYRLGVLGFLSTEDAAAPGNQGLKDQTLALTWVKDNIAAFGGDPDRITIFGESAGAASVHHQLLVPQAAGLFSAAILHSGNALTPWGRGRDFLKNAQDIAQSFACPTLPTDALVDCLQTVPQHQIQQSVHLSQVWNYQPLAFGPWVGSSDGYLPDDPVKLIQEGRYHHVPTIMGVNRDEMSMETVKMYVVNPHWIDELMVNFTTTGPASLSLYHDEDPVNTAYTVYDTYGMGDVNITKEDCDNLTRMYTEGHFLIPHDWTVQRMSDHIILYAYELHHRGQHSLVDGYIFDEDVLPQAQNYVSHTDDLQYLFYPRYAQLNTTEDLMVGDIFLTAWTNFAKYRNPTPDGSLGFVWEQSNPVDLQHLKILPQPYMEADQRAEARAFWESLPLRINSLLNP